MQNMERWLMVLVAVLLVIVAVMVFAQYGADGSVLFSSDIETTAVLMMAVVAVAVIVGETIRSGNYGEGYIKLIDRLTSDTDLQKAIELEYVAMPPGLHKNAIRTFADIAGALVKLTPTQQDDKLAGWLQDALDGKIESLEPTNDPGSINQ